MPEEQEFSLRESIRAAIAGASTTDPEEIAVAVARSVPRKLVQGALVYCLTPLVADMMRAEHNAALDEVQRARRTPARSAKVAAWQDASAAWQRALQTILPTEDGRKRLAECTRDDLLYAARIRREQAAAIEAHADRYEAYAALLKKHRALRMADLPERVLAQYLEGEDAA